MSTPNHTPELRPIPDSPGYFADEAGNIWSTGHVRKHKLLKLRPFPSAFGRLAVWVWYAGKRRTKTVHRLVAMAWLGSGDGAPVVRHLDGNHLNNAASNLAWGTQLENAADAKRHGTRAAGDRHGSRLHPERVPRGLRNGSYTHPESRPRGDRNGSRTKPETRPRGERHGSAKLTAEQVRAIRSICAEQRTTRIVVAQQFGVSRTTVNEIVNRKIWTHIDDKAESRLRREECGL